MSHTVWLWIGFAVIVISAFVLDMGVLHKKDRPVPLKEALSWVAAWISLALLFCAGVYLWRDPESGTNFLTAYLVELSLSIDNLFVFLVIFNFFSVDAAHQHRALRWGILGALLMRAAFIVAGVALISNLEWVIYLFGAFLIYTGIKLAVSRSEHVHPEKNPLLKVLRRVMPVTTQYHGSHFFVRENARWFATPLFVVVLVIESTDVVFAVDSIPAVLGITLDTFVVYTSNVFAILGLRSLYFALAGIMSRFYYLRYGLTGVLVFVGIKMIAGHWVHFPAWVSLAAISGLLLASVLASFIWKPKDPHPGLKL